ncbi:SIT4 phosphatase-associated family protein [Citrus sinensis]|uniref:SIT4 phosphatase-associated family protein n=1 Tax=Citrus sinensis TaxID=2711 RepID=A0ACB8ND92_CITSI|nr:SIT4 phosphatase-associated family protein [Citrus sinensis]
MFWRMAGLSTASPVETILDKENFTLEELLDEDDIIQECKALNGRLINFLLPALLSSFYLLFYWLSLRERAQVEQLIQYIVVEAPEDAEKRRTFKFPFVACEIFTCEVDIILKTLVEDEELMNLLFSFLEPKDSHSTLLAGYFSKAHQEIMARLVDLIGITSIMEVLIRLIGADEHMYTNFTESMQWIEDTNVLEMIVDKFSSSDSPEVHANAAETLCSITRSAPPALAAKISSPNFIGRLFRHALENSRPKSVLVNSLSICISLLDPKRLTLGTYYMFNRQLTHGSTVTVNPETVEGMLGRLGDLLKLLDVSSEESSLLTTYGKLQPPLGKHRLKIVEFISVLLTVGSEAAEKELIRHGAVRRILDLFFEYPYNNFLHHHVENIILSCLECKNAPLIEHLLHECNLVGKILEAEKNFTLKDSNKENSEWNDWQINVLSKRNTLENIYQWACGDVLMSQYSNSVSGYALACCFMLLKLALEYCLRPTALHDRGRDSDDDDYQNRDYDVAALANNLSQAFRYGIYSNDDVDEAQGSLERDDEDVYFDDESAEVVISSLRLGDDQESGSLFTNSNWFAFEDDRVSHERAAGSLASPSPNIEETGVTNGGGHDQVTVGEDDLDDTATSAAVPVSKSEDSDVGKLPNDSVETGSCTTEKPPTWVEWRERPDSSNPSSADEPVSIPNGELQDQGGNGDVDVPEPSPSSSNTEDANITTTGELSKSIDENPSSKPSEPSESGSPSEPAESGTPSEPAESGTPSEPAESGTPSEPSESVDGNHPSSDPAATEVVKTVAKAEGTPEVTKDDKDVVNEAEN